MGLNIEERTRKVWMARYDASKRYGVVFNEPPPDQCCERILEIEQINKEANDEMLDLASQRLHEEAEKANKAKEEK